jgi:hypothetical protein
LKSLRFSGGVGAVALLIVVVLLLGCESKNLLPDRIDLTFKALPLEELRTASISPDWKLVKSIPFGTIGQEQAELNVYDENLENNILPKTYVGLLKVKEAQYLIQDLSASLVEKEQFDCSSLCVFQRFFPDQTRYKLLGSLELFANGPGRKLFIVNDVTSGTLKSFERWGEPGFIDLDADGTDEFIIEFQGLHLSWPDLTIVRSGKDTLEICDSVVNSIRKNPGDYVNLLRDSNPPMILFSNAVSEDEPIYYYSYSNGKLLREEK